LLSYLALCARASISVLDYRDDATGELVLDARGGGKFEEIVLRPIVTIANAADKDRAMELHDKAHELCFIANSCSVPIHHRAEIRT
jgi:organic hydroperoxide reductase OsmC/OhrA